MRCIKKIVSALPVLGMLTFSGCSGSIDTGITTHSTVSSLAFDP